MAYNAISIALVVIACLIESVCYCPDYVRQNATILYPASRVPQWFTVFSISILNSDFEEEQNPSLS